VPSKIKPPNLYKELKARQERLRYKLRGIAGKPQGLIVPIIPETTAEDLPRAIIKVTVRVRDTEYYLNILEDFRDADGTPFLYGFKYSLRPQDPHLEPMFRFECHPEVQDNYADGESEEAANVVSQNPYSSTPHFHPHSLVYPINRLHYPFQRAERMNIVFALIAWIEVDLIKRFIDSGRVNKAS
jgi:hypothetical protein